MTTIVAIGNLLLNANSLASLLQTGLSPLFSLPRTFFSFSFSSRFIQNDVVRVSLRVGGFSILRYVSCSMKYPTPQTSWHSCLINAGKERKFWESEAGQLTKPIAGKCPLTCNWCQSRNWFVLSLKLMPFLLRRSPPENQSLEQHQADEELDIKVTEGERNIANCSWFKSRVPLVKNWNSCFCRNKTGNSERAVWLHLARSGRQSRRGIWFILPARGACHKRMPVTSLVAKGSLCEGGVNKGIVSHFQLLRIISEEILPHSSALPKDFMARVMALLNRGSIHSAADATFSGMSFTSSLNCWWRSIQCHAGVEYPRIDAFRRVFG